MSKTLNFFRVTFFICTLVVTSTFLYGQPAEIPYHVEPYRLESGFFNGSNQAGVFLEVYSATINVDDAPWIQLHFEKTDLSRESYLIITSLKDGYQQKLDASSLMQWNNYSAFFNGQAVELKLFVGPFDQNVFVHLNEVVVGDWYNGTPYTSICGPTDDRIASNQPATGRLLNIGCTGWIIPNGKIVTAGHCLSGANVMQFNVPLSLPGGTIQHPPPEDQYNVDASTIVGTGSGVGNDWGVFEVFPNSITGLMPKDAQSAYWPLAQDLGPDSIRITGYGVDNGTANQTQQTHIGPNAGSSGNTMRYRTDTQGGNSGSPVINGLTNVAVGVHTHGGCTSSGGNNNGTSFFHSDFWDAVDMGAGGCPVEAASNPNPANGSVGVSLNLSELTWTNGAGAVTNELYFGTDPGSLSLVQSGSLATSWTITGGPLNYGTTYYWQVIEIGDTCSTFGPVWNFKTVLDPNLVIDTMYVYPQSVAYWTGTTDGVTKTENSLVRGLDTEDGWFMFDISPITDNATITEVTFFGYVNATNWPYWSLTPLPGLNPLTATAGELKTAIEANSGQGTAYVWSNEPSTFTPGWHNYLCETWTNSDLQAALVQDWFAAGMDSRDNSTTYFLTWDGWAEAEVPYLCVVYEWIVPVELTTFTASVNESNVTLNWSTATETNNQGFQIERSLGGEFENIGFVAGHGTTAEAHAYSYTDKNVEVGTYSYRLKQIDFDGTFEYSDVVEIDVIAPKTFSLSQNYPNPFNPSTTVEFSLVTDSRVSLKVFDVLGQEVMTVVNSNYAAGVHTVDIDASLLNSGVFIYQIEANGVDGAKFVDVKKMMILK